MLHQHMLDRLAEHISLIHKLRSVQPQRKCLRIKFSLFSHFIYRLPLFTHPHIPNCKFMLLRIQANFCFITYDDYFFFIADYRGKSREPSITQFLTLNSCKGCTQNLISGWDGLCADFIYLLLLADSLSKIVLRSSGSRVDCTFENGRRVLIFTLGGSIFNS